MLTQHNCLVLQLSCFKIVSITITSHTATCWSYCYRKSGFKLSDSIRRSCRSYFWTTITSCTVGMYCHWQSNFNCSDSVWRSCKTHSWTSLQYSTVDTLQSIPTHITSTNTSGPIQSDPLVMGVVEVHSVHSQLSSSGTPFQFQLPNSHLPTRITPPETLLEAEETLWVIPSNKIGEDRLQCIFKSSGS